MSPPTTQQITDRLEILYRKLEVDGRYVSANTVALAIDALSNNGATNMTHFAAYDDASIYGIGETADAAIEDARTESHDAEATFQTAPISDEFSEWIRENGWDGKHRSFALVDGFLVDTTDQ